jgi:hypothetical protein
MAKVLGGMGSRLFVSLRDKQSLAYSVGCWSASYFAGGSFVFYIVTTEDKLAQAHAGLKKQIEGAKSTLTEAELKRAQQALIGQEVTQSATNSEQAMKAVLDLLYGAGINASKADVAKIEKVTVADLHRVARKYFDLARAVTVILTQEKQERELGKKAASEKSNPQATPRGALALGIKLLREKAYRQFLEKMLHPTERQALVRGSSMDELAAEFAKQKAGPLLKLLEGLGDQKPRLLEDGRTAIFQDESGQDLELAKVGDRWYLVN